MTIWWEALSEFQQIMFFIAMPATLMMLIFLLLMIFGIEGSDAFDGSDIGGDLDGPDMFNNEPLTAFSGLRIFTLRGILVFLSVGAWVSFLLSDPLNNFVAALIGIVCGCAASVLMAIAFKASLKLESEGNLNYNNAIGKNGAVYIKVPKNRTGRGKVTLTLQERFIEVSAITDDDEDILTGMNVEIIGVEDASTIIVKKKLKGN